MKKIFKKNLKILFSILLTAFITASGVVYAAQILASDISFKPDSRNSNWNAKNVEQALNDLYNMSEIYVYPYQKISVKKGTNEYKYIFNIKDEDEKIIFEKEYECDIWGVFSQIKDTYEYKGRQYTIVATGYNDKTNFVGKIYDGEKLVIQLDSLANGANGSWDTNGSIIISSILYDNKVYDQRLD